MGREPQTGLLPLAALNIEERGVQEETRRKGKAMVTVTLSRLNVQGGCAHQLRRNHNKEQVWEAGSRAAALGPGCPN